MAVGIDTQELTAGADDAADHVESSFSGIKAAAAGIAVGGLFAMGLTNAMDATAANDKLARQLGLTDEEAKRAGDVAGDVFSAGFGESISDVNDALGSVASSMGDLSELTNDELQSMTKSALMLADTFEIDVADASTAAGQLISNGLVKDGTEAFDVLTAAAQTLPKSMVEDIPAVINEYGKHFARLGLDAQTSFGLMSQYVKAGGRDIDQAADVLHEFARITSEETDRAAAGFKALGLDSGDMLAAINKGGPGAEKALTQTLDALRGVKDPAKQAQLAIELFGDMAGEGANALWAMDPATAAASSGLDNVKGAAKDATDAMEDSPAQMWDSAMRTLATTIGDALTPVLLAVMGFLKENPALISAITPVVLAVAAALAIWAAVQWVLNSALLANPMTWIILGIVALVAAIVVIATKTTWFQDLWSVAMDGVGAAWDWIWDKLQQGFKLLEQLFLNFTGPGLIIHHWDTIMDAIGSATDWVNAKVADGMRAVLSAIDWLGALPGRVGRYFGGMLTSATEKSLALVEYVRGIPDRVETAVGDLGHLLYGAGASIIQGLMDGITGMLGSLQHKLGSVTSMIPDWKGPMTLDMRLLTPSGEAIMGGLMVGIDNEEAALQRQLQGITTSIPGNVSAGVAQAAGGSGGRTELVISSAGGAVNDAILELVRNAIEVRGGDPVAVLTPNA